MKQKSFQYGSEILKLSNYLIPFHHVFAFFLLKTAFLFTNLGITHRLLHLVGI